MRRIALACAAVFSIATALAGCQTDAQTTTSAEAPPDAKAIILSNKGKLWKDPDSIKNASISAPQLSMGIWHVCVCLNAKNSHGGYSGETTGLIYIYTDGRPPWPVGDDAPYCNNFPLKPFPELEGGYKPPRGDKA